MRCTTSSGVVTNGARSVLSDCAEAVPTEKNKYMNNNPPRINNEYGDKKKIGGDIDIFIF
jgi:hypothetical protein